MTKACDRGRICEVDDILFSFLRRRIQVASSHRRASPVSAPVAAPTPMPAFAPVLRLDEVEPGAVVLSDVGVADVGEVAVDPEPSVLVLLVLVKDAEEPLLNDVEEVVNGLVRLPVGPKPS
jgi:hypothetical protein